MYARASCKSTGTNSSRNSVTHTHWHFKALTLRRARICPSAGPPRSGPEHQQDRRRLRAAAIKSWTEKLTQFNPKCARAHETSVVSKANRLTCLAKPQVQQSAWWQLLDLYIRTCIYIYSVSTSHMDNHSINGFYSEMINLYRKLQKNHLDNSLQAVSCAWLAPTCTHGHTWRFTLDILYSNFSF